MSIMTDDDKKILREHLQKNLEMLGEVVEHEADERHAIRENLAAFHTALDERKKILDAEAEKKSAQDDAELNAQINQLKNFIATSLDEQKFSTPS